MRVGQNPAKNLKEVMKPNRITVAVLNYIPFIGGFYAEMLDVLITCLSSIRETSDLPYDLLVFDNGSCAEVVDYLVEQKNLGNIQYLMLSEHNLGKGGAWNIMLSGAPGEIIAFADNDCLFFKGWLSKSIELLETYPNVGMVTARPYRTPPEFYTSTVAWAQLTTGVELERGQLVPFEVIHSFNLSLGQSDEYSRDLIAKSEDILIRYQDVPAVIGGSHWQFTGFKSTLARFLPFDMDRPMGQVRQLDRRMNEDGLLRLMTAEPLVMNLSNTLPDDLRQKAVGSAKKDMKAANSKFFEMPIVKKFLLALHDRIFRLYFQK